MDALKVELQRLQVEGIIDPIQLIKIADPIVLVT